MSKLHSSVLQDNPSYEYYNMLIMQHIASETGQEWGIGRMVDRPERKDEIYYVLRMGWSIQGGWRVLQKMGTLDTVYRPYLL